MVQDPSTRPQNDSTSTFPIHGHFSISASSFSFMPAPMSVLVWLLNPQPANLLYLFTPLQSLAEPAKKDLRLGIDHFVKKLRLQGNEDRGVHIGFRV